MSDIQEKASTTVPEEKVELDLHKVYEKRITTLADDPDFINEANKLKAFMEQDLETAAKVWALDRRDALNDSLTGLGNRRALIEDLKRQIADRERNIKDGKYVANLSIVYIDADYLKSVNDGKIHLNDEGDENSGHDVGDKYLITVAKAILESVRDGDYVTRLSGDEFVAVLHGANAIQAIATSGRIEDRFKELKLDAELPEYTGLSMGVAQWSQGGLPQELINKADKDLYKSKHRRRKNNNYEKT